MVRQPGGNRHTIEWRGWGCNDRHESLGSVGAPVVARSFSPILPFHPVQYHAARRDGLALSIYPPYDSSCSIRLSTQSNAPSVIFPGHYSHTPAMLTFNGAPQFGQWTLSLSLELTPRWRMNVQYSEKRRGEFGLPLTTWSCSSAVK